MRMFRFILSLVCLGLAGVPSLCAATITVTNLNDSGPGSLRQAIIDADPADSIDFSVNGNILLTTGELTIGKNLTILGPGESLLTVSGGNNSRVFSINAGTVTIAYLTIADGHATDPDPTGGGVQNSATLLLFAAVIRDCRARPGSLPAYGGGVLNAGTLYMQDCTLSGNRAAGDPVNDAYGGGLFNTSTGTASIERSTFSGNLASAMESLGGGICMPKLGGGTVEVSNCTFYDNYAAIIGGGVYGDDGMTLIHCTIVENLADGYGGGIAADSLPGPIVQNTIVANNESLGDHDIYIGIQSLDYNLIEDTGSAAISGTTAHNLYGQDPVLEPLADNGGHTWTCAVSEGSPVLEYIPMSECPVYNDQRNVMRPQNDLCEIGAFEKSWFAAVYINCGIPNPTSDDTLPFIVSFNHLAFQFDSEDDLIITRTGTVQYTGVTGFAGGMNFAVQIEGVTGDGEITVAVDTASDVIDELGLPLDFSVTSPPMIIDNSGPAVSIGPPSPVTTVTGPVQFTVTYSDAASISLNSADVSLVVTGDVAGSVSVTGAGLTERIVTVSDITGTGTLAISVAAGTAADSLGNLSPAAGPSAVCWVNMVPAVPLAPWTTVILILIAGWLLRRH